MTEIKAVINTPGKILLTQALTGFRLFYPAGFKVGAAVGFDPSPDATDVAGAVSFEGSNLLVQVKQMATDTARYIITIPEGVGPFHIGNIMLFARSETQDMVPFAFIVLPVPYLKVVSDPNLPSSSPGIGIPGNRFVCNVTIKHSLDAVIQSVEVVTPTFSTLAFFEDIASVPPPTLNNWTSFVVHDDPRTKTPAFLTKRDDDTYWGTPFWQPYRAPNFGVIDGGRDGDGYKADQSGFAWGHSYLTPENRYSGILGGSSYSTTNDGFTGSVGGKPYNEDI